MRLFLDENVPHPLRRVLPGHDVRTVAGMRCGGVKNGALLRLIEDGGFDVFVTGDKNLLKQQKMEDLHLAVLVLSAISWPVLRKNLSEIVRAVDMAEPGTAKQIQCGLFLPGRAKRNQPPYA